MTDSIAFQLPDHVTPLDKNDTFHFSCHKGVSCFTECCRMLELALTPYDVLQLKKSTSLHSQQLLDQYIIVEQEPGEPFPRFYLTMVDDGRASCVFVSPEGCTVYSHRPSACRTYPLGRALSLSAEDPVQEHYVLVKEEHCKGFLEPESQKATQYSINQGLTDYNCFNDAVAEIHQHDAIRKGFIPSAKQIESFVLALYNIDTFREQALKGNLDGVELTAAEGDKLNKDEQLLLFAVNWLKQQLYSPF